MGYARWPFRDFESYICSWFRWKKLLILKQYNSYFITYEIPLGIDTIKDVSEAVYAMGDHEGTLQ